MAHSSAKRSFPPITGRLFPALGFVFALCVLVVVVYDTGYGALPPAEKRYSTARAAVDALKADAKRNGYREHWLKLADEFYDIYALDTKWANRPAALYRSAETLEELAGRSYAPKDFRLAVERYEQVALRHATSRLADDALYRAALIRAQSLNDRKGALQLLKRIRTQYARGDMASRAATLEKTLLSDARGAARERSVASAVAELTQVSWTTLDKNRVRIVVELDRDAGWQARLEEASKNGPARLILDMLNTAPQRQVKPGARVKGSLLTRVRVAQAAADRTRLMFDFSAARRYDARVEQDPFRIVLTVAANGPALPKGVAGRVGFAERQQPTPEAERVAAVRFAPERTPPQSPARAMQNTRARKVGAADSFNMAEQLGLTVQSVFIDAGHGGKDPGTIHNNVLERDLVLDIARRVGRLLAANGLEVAYSRTGNVTVPLSARPRKANAQRADLFVSIHINANPRAEVSGFETYYLDLANNTQSARVAALENAASDRKLGDMQKVLADIMLNARSQESNRLAGDIQRRAVSRISKRGFTVKNGGTKAAPFHVLIGAGMPAVLVEVGYCTNPAEARNLLNPSYRHAVAEGIAEGVMAYRNRLQRRNSAEITLTPKS